MALEKIMCCIVNHIAQQDDPIELADEIESLVDTWGGDVIETFSQRTDRIEAAHYFGKGKCDEIAAYLEEHKEIKMVIVNVSLSPIQQRNLEKLFGRSVIDRQQVILEIFDRHARTNEAKLQVQLAELEFMRSRLRHQWTHIFKQQGGSGFRGPGEKQIEMDRQAIRKKISFLKDKLKKLETVRTTQRKNRHDDYSVSIVGYTNAGKSSLLKLLSKKDLYIEDKLFATLDTTTRTVFIDDGTNGRNLLISDTVGFISNLPHQLVASFKSTLDELRYADLIVEVIDVGSKGLAHKMGVVDDVLKELKVDEKPRIFVFNKIDLLSEEDLTSMRIAFRDLNAVFVSVKGAQNITDLKIALLRQYDQWYDSSRNRV